ncbi:MAG: hypothetical protein H6925_04735 [Holosporaceae bacterium]|nr:MAG: hypothetical protein H6925_04735 [Holosporaceae bacterium]
MTISEGWRFYGLINDEYDQFFFDIDAASLKIQRALLTGLARLPVFNRTSKRALSSDKLGWLHITHSRKTKNRPMHLSIRIKQSVQESLSVHAQMSNANSEIT